MRAAESVAFITQTIDIVECSAGSAWARLSQAQPVTCESVGQYFGKLTPKIGFLRTRSMPSRKVKCDPRQTTGRVTLLGASRNMKNLVATAVCAVLSAATGYPAVAAAQEVELPAVSPFTVQDEPDSAATPAAAAESEVESGSDAVTEESADASSDATSPATSVPGADRAACGALFRLRGWDCLEWRADRHTFTKSRVMVSWSLKGTRVLTSITRSLWIPHQSTRSSRSTRRLASARNLPRSRCRCAVAAARSHRTNWTATSPP